MRALRWWKETHRGDAAPEDPFFIQSNGDRILVTGRLAERWRAMLEASTKRVGIYRPELFNRSAKRLATRAHDLRGLFVTYALANGMTETWVADRTGHKSSTMINAYRQTARSTMRPGSTTSRRSTSRFPRLQPHRRLRTRLQLGAVPRSTMPARCKRPQNYRW